MPQLSDFEKGKIVAYDDCGFSQRDIGRKINRDHKTVGKFLKRFKETGTIKRKTGSGRKRIFNERFGTFVLFFSFIFLIVSLQRLS